LPRETASRSGTPIADLIEVRRLGANKEAAMTRLITATLGGVAAAITLSGCAAINHTRPGDMTVAGHEQAARAEATKADEAAKRATVAGRGGENEKLSAVHHRELANEHAAAAALRRKEVAETCAGVSAPAPLSSMRIVNVEPIREAAVSPEHQSPRGYYPTWLKGARITATPDGIATPDAARGLECEAARVSAGMDAASAWDPLAVRTAKTTVRVADARLVVEVRGGNTADAEEILKRAESLATAAH
jgi:hypothetical protein